MILSGPDSGNGYRPDIDGLRAIAVWAVIAFHAQPSLLPGGYLGVDVFFVLSGFLISGIVLRDLRDGRFSFSEFYRRRIRRILPALLVVLASVWLMGWHILLGEDFGALGRHVFAAAAFVSNFALGQEAGYFDKNAEFKPLLHLWSLGVEEQFYLFWPAALFWAWRARWRLDWMIGALTLASLAAHFAVASRNPTWDFFLLPTRFWELSVGAYLVMARRPESARVAETAGAVGAALVGAAFFIAHGWLATTLLPVVAVTGAALLVLAGPASGCGRLLAARPLVWFGLISYPLYLWHWPLLSYARIVELGEPTAAVKWTLVLTSVALAWATYRWIERPIRFGGSWIAAAWRPRMPAVLIAALALAATVGLVTIEADGFPGRFPDPIVALATHKPDLAAYRASTCLLGPTQDHSSFDASCDGPSAAGSKPLIFLWGDSHAAQLLPGLLALSKDTGYVIAQFNSSACPPVLGLEVKGFSHCRQNNDFVVRKIQELRPQVVALAGQWWAVAQTDFARLEHTISTVKQIAHVKNIVLIGPVPVWVPSLPERLIDYYRTSVPKHLPDRMQGAVLFPAIDTKLAEIAAREGLILVLPSRVFCTVDGCLTQVSHGGSKEPVAWDSAHLTNAGSRVLAAAIYDALGAKAPPETAGGRAQR